MNRFELKMILASAIAACLIFVSCPASAVEIGTPQPMKKYEERLLFPHCLSLQVGFHMYFSQELEKDGREPKKGVVPGEEEFEYALDKGFEEVEMASTSYKLGYGYRFNRYFRLIGYVGMFHQKRTEETTLNELTAKTKYRITGIHLDASARLLLPVSTLDFYLGAGPDVTYIIKEFQIKGSVESEDDVDGYDIYHDFQGYAPGGHIELGVDVRLRDNWSMTAEYRPSFAPMETDDGPLNVGGHFGYLGTVYHF